MGYSRSSRILLPSKPCQLEPAKILSDCTHFKVHSERHYETEFEQADLLSNGTLNCLAQASTSACVIPPCAILHQCDVFAVLVCRLLVQSAE